MKATVSITFCTETRKLLGIFYDTENMLLIDLFATEYLFSKSVAGNFDKQASGVLLHFNQHGYFKCVVLSTNFI